MADVRDRERTQWIARAPFRSFAPIIVDVDPLA